MKITGFTLLLVLFVSCHPGNKKALSEDKGEEFSVDYTEKVVSLSDMLNLKSYYLSAFYQKDSVRLLYGYNTKAHALDCYDLVSLQSSQIPFFREGPSAVLPRISGIFVSSPDSIWVYDASLRFLLLNASGEVIATVNPREALASQAFVLADVNYAIATDKFYYDAQRGSLWFGVRDDSVSPGCFKVCEYAVNAHKMVEEYVLQPSVEVGDVYSNKYGYMNKPNITFTNKYILYNYPIESHVYVMDRENKETRVIAGESHYVKNVASKLATSTGIEQWDRHKMENPHFYEVLPVPGKDAYVRLIGGEMDYDAVKNQPDLIWDREMYMTVFKGDFSAYREVELRPCRYDPGTAWCALDDGLLLFVNNVLSSEELTENLVFDIATWEDAE